MRDPLRPADGVSQLTELMRYEPTAQTPPTPTPVDPSRRRKRRRRRALVAGIVAFAILASLGGYTAYALTAPLGHATLEADAPDVVTPKPRQCTSPWTASTP